jgi:hypothetical protein
MKTVLQGLAGLAVTLALCGAAPAGWRYVARYDGPAYHVTYGVRFSHGYYFRGPGWRQFAYRYWAPRYHAYVYWHPGSRAWYYWSSARAVYYPLSYAAVVAPAGDPPPGIASLPSALPSDVPPPG